MISSLTVLIYSYQKKRVHYTLILVNIYPFVLVSLIWVYLEATLLNNRKTFSLTGRYFHLPQPVYHCGIREFRELHERGKVKGVRCAVLKEHYQRKVLPSRYLKGIPEHCSFNNTNVLFPRTSSVDRWILARKCHFLVSIIIIIIIIIKI